MAGISCLLCTYWCLDNELHWYLKEKCKECQSYCGSPRSFFFLAVAEWIHVLIFSGQKLVPQSSTCVFFSNKCLSDNMIRRTLQTCWFTLQTNLINIEIMLQNSLLVWNFATAISSAIFIQSSWKCFTLQGCWYNADHIMPCLINSLFSFLFTVPSGDIHRVQVNWMGHQTSWRCTLTHADRHKHTLRFCPLTARCCVSPAWRWQVSRLTSTPRRPHGPGRCRPKLPTSSPITPRRSECPSHPLFRWLIPAAASVQSPAAYYMRWQKKFKKFICSRVMRVTREVQMEGRK